MDKKEYDVNPIDWNKIYLDIKRLIVRLKDESILKLGQTRGATAIEEVLSSEFDYLATNIPNLYCLIIMDKDIDWSKLDTIKRMHQSVEAKKISIVDAGNMIAKVGNEEYIKPLLNDPEVIKQTLENKRKYEEDLRKKRDAFLKK